MAALVSPKTNIRIGSEPVPQESEVHDSPLKPAQNLPILVKDVEKDNEPTQQPVVLGSVDDSSCDNDAKAEAKIMLNGQEHYEDGLEKRQPSPTPECNNDTAKLKKKSFPTTISDHRLHPTDDSNIGALVADKNDEDDNSSSVEGIHGVTCSDKHQPTMLLEQHQNPSEISIKALRLQEFDQNCDAKAIKITRQNSHDNLSGKTTIISTEENEANSKIECSSCEDQPLISSSTDSSSMSIQMQQKIQNEDNAIKDCGQQHQSLHCSPSESTTIDAANYSGPQNINILGNLSGSATTTCTEDNEANLLTERDNMREDQPLVSSPTDSVTEIRIEDDTTEDSGQQHSQYISVTEPLQRACKVILDYKKMLGIAFLGIVFVAVVTSLCAIVRDNHTLEKNLKIQSVILNDKLTHLKLLNETIENLKDEREKLTEKLAIANQTRCTDYATPGSKPFPCNLTECRNKTLNDILRPSFEARNTSTIPFPVGCYASNWALYGRPQCFTERGKYAKLHAEFNPDCPNELRFSCICTGRGDRFAMSRDCQMQYEECPRG